MEHLFPYIEELMHEKLTVCKCKPTKTYNSETGKLTCVHGFLDEDNRKEDLTWEDQYNIFTDDGEILGETKKGMSKYFNKMYKDLNINNYYYDKDD